MKAKPRGVNSKQPLTERLDRQRYWAVVLQAVALVDILIETTVWYACRLKIGGDHFGVSSYLILDGDQQVFALQGFVGLPLLIAAGIWYFVIWCRTVRDKEVRAALYNEMYLANKHRSQRITLWVVMCALLAGFFFEDYSQILRQICEIIFFLGFSTLKVSWLILNRSRRQTPERQTSEKQPQKQ
jgi:hypothetical protein